MGTIGYYFCYLLRYALNIPYQDEIYDVLGFLSELVKSEDWHTSLQLFFIKWNEHSTASTRLVYYLSYRLFGEVNFVTLTVLANTALTVFVGLIYLRLRDQNYRWLILLPVVFTLFSFRAYYTALWSMAAFSYFYVLVYGFCCCYCLHKLTRLRLLLAIFFGALATFSLASGQLVWLAGLLGVAHQTFVTKNISKWYLPAWILAAAAVLLVWHSRSWGHPDLQSENIIHLPTADDFTTIQNSVLVALLAQLKFFLAMIGGVVSDSSVLLATVTGIGLLLGFVFFVGAAWRGSDIRLELCCVYVLLTLAAMAHGRAEFVVLAESLNSRFSVPSVMLVCILWTLLIVRLRVRSIAALYLVALLAGINHLMAYATYSEAIIHFHDVQAKRYNNNVFWLLGVPLEESARVVANAMALGIYKGPDRPVPLDDSSGKKMP